LHNHTQISIFFKVYKWPISWGSLCVHVWHMHTLGKHKIVNRFTLRKERWGEASTSFWFCFLFLTLSFHIKLNSLSLFASLMKQVFTL
jgi:hypothetical protein